MTYVEFQSDADILKEIRDNSTKVATGCVDAYLSMPGISYLKCRQASAMSTAYRTAMAAMRHHQRYYGGPIR